MEPFLCVDVLIVGVIMFWFFMLNGVLVFTVEIVTGITKLFAKSVKNLQLDHLLRMIRKYF